MSLHVVLCVQACGVPFYPTLLSRFPIETLRGEARDTNLPLAYRAAVMELLAQVRGREVDVCGCVWV